MQFFVSLYLQLHDNLIERLSAEIGDLSKLRSLNLALNKINSLPLNMFKLCELRFLDLGNNLLKEIDPAIGDLIMLESLVGVLMCTPVLD